MAASPLTSRLPSPPPIAEDQIGSKSPLTMGFQPGPTHKKVQPDPTRRIRPGTKAADMAEGPPMVPLNEINSAFQHAEFLKAKYYHLTHPDRSDSIAPLDSKAAHDLVTAPPGVNRHVWLYELCRFLCQKTNLLVVSLFNASPPCSVETCNEMRASEWQYLCAVHNPPKACSAIDYCCHTLDWAVNTLTSPANFPSRMDIDADNSLATIIRRVYRVFAHSWFQHNDEFWKVERVTGLYTLFYTTCTVYDFVPEHHYTIPRDLTDPQSDAAGVKTHHPAPMAPKRRPTTIDTGANGTSASIRIAASAPRSACALPSINTDAGPPGGGDDDDDGRSIVSTSDTVILSGGGSGGGGGGDGGANTRLSQFPTIDTSATESFPSFSSTEQIGELPTPEAAHWAEASEPQGTASFIFSPTRRTRAEPAAEGTDSSNGKPVGEEAQSGVSAADAGSNLAPQPEASGGQQPHPQHGRPGPDEEEDEHGLRPGEAVSELIGHGGSASLTPSLDDVGDVDEDEDITVFEPTVIGVSDPAPSSSQPGDPTRPIPAFFSPSTLEPGTPGTTVDTGPAESDSSQRESTSGQESAVSETVSPAPDSNPELTEPGAGVSEDDDKAGTEQQQQQQEQQQSPPPSASEDGVVEEAVSASPPPPSAQKEPDTNPADGDTNPAPTVEETKPETSDSAAAPLDKEETKPIETTGPSEDIITTGTTTTAGTEPTVAEPAVESKQTDELAVPDSSDSKKPESVAAVDTAPTAPAVSSSSPGHAGSSSEAGSEESSPAGSEESTPITDDEPASTTATAGAKANEPKKAPEKDRKGSKRSKKKKR